VADISSNIENLHTPFKMYQYSLPDAKGEIKFEWQGGVLPGIACDLKSPGFKAINHSTSKVLGSSNPYSLTGSLPIVADLQKAGFDLQMCGYGITKVYHGTNEYCSISDMVDGFQILKGIIEFLNETVL